MPNPPVLYVEDEKDDILLMQLAFRKSGISHPLVTVPDGEKAIDYLAGKGSYADREKYPMPALVLLDLNLPIKSGFEVLDWIRNQPSMQTLPVIIFSSSAAEKDYELCRRMNATEYAVKPGKHSDLIDFVTNLAEKWLKVRNYSPGYSLGFSGTSSGGRAPY